MTLDELEFATTFEPHPLEGQSRFGLLGLLAGLYGLVPFELEPATDEQKRLAKEIE
jgi:hypothetical protein